MPQQDIHLFVFDGLSDWETGYEEPVFLLEDPLDRLAVQHGGQGQTRLVKKRIRNDGEGTLACYG